MAARVHWTQTPAGRKRMSEVQKKAVQTRRDNKAKGITATRPASGRALAREEVNALAKHGAKARLIELERECEKLRMFLGVGGTQ